MIMPGNNARNYTLKDEELPVICNLTSISFSRDRREFETFSPKFTSAYGNTFDTTISTVSNVIQPQSEILEQKMITSRMFNTMNNLSDTVNRVSTYIRLTSGELNLTDKEFGLVNIRSSIARKDSESVIDNLHVILANIAKYKEQLTRQGLTEELISKFTDALATLDADKKKQYEMIIHRKAVVQDNLGLFNGLYGTLTEILAVGKTLYKATDPVKRQEYTLSDLKKRVHRIITHATPVNPPSPAS